MENQLVQKQQASIALTATMQQSLQILRMSNAELSEMLAREAEVNPFLRVVRKGIGNVAGGGLAPGLEAAAVGPNLHEVIESQIRQTFRNARDQRIADHLAMALAPTGWFEGDLAVLAAEIACPLSAAEAVLEMLQRFEPSGVFARSLEECLAIQARDAGLLTPAFAALLRNLPKVANGNREELAELCGVSHVELLVLLRQIRSLDPKPGLRYWNGDTIAVPPDLILHGGPGNWQIEVNEGAFPAVRLQITNADLAARTSNELIRASLARARFLNAALTRRKATLLNVALSIVRRQSRFFNGSDATPGPLTLTDIAGDCGLHISTISRSVAGMLIATPRGRMPLKTLFSRAVPLSSGAQISRAQLGEIIRNLIRAENGFAPLHDCAVAAELCRRGYEVTRRTVANYRRDLGIPNAAARQDTAIVQSVRIGRAAPAGTASPLPVEGAHQSYPGR